MKQHSKNAGFTIPPEFVEATRMSIPELKQEIAIMLFQKEKLSLAYASKFAGMDRLQFQHLLASRRIPLHYDVEDFEKDLDTLNI